MPASEQTHFGRRAVRLDEKQDLVDDVFHKVAGGYDLMNDLMSFGLHGCGRTFSSPRFGPRGRAPSRIWTSPAARAMSPSASRAPAVH